jgi:hypothetical protein
MSKDNFQPEIEFRKMQEAVANLIRVKDEYARGLFAIYSAYQEAGFTKKESMELLKAFITGAK